jgi:tape measure domain-containing protein
MGRINKNTIFDNKNIEEGANKIIADFEKISAAAVKNAKKIKGASGFKDLFGSSAETKKIIGELNTTITKLKTTIDSLTTSLNKNATANKKSRKNVKSLTADTIELKKVKKQLIIAQAKQQIIGEKEVKQLIEEKVALKQLQDALAKTVVGTRQHSAALKKLQLAQKKSIEEHKKATLAIGNNARARFKQSGIIKKGNRLISSSIAKHTADLATQKRRTIGMGKEWKANWKLYQVEKKRATQIPKTVKATGGLIGSLKNLAASYLGITALIMGIQRLFKEVFSLTKKLDSLDFAMEKVITSQRELGQTQTWLYDISVAYGATILSLTERYIKFRAAAIQSNISARETQKIFETMTKAAGVLGLKTDETAGIFLALEQMLSKGKVTTEELRRQLGERLPGAFGIMADALGVTLPMLDKMLRAGQILSAEVLPLFAEEVEKAYGIESVKKVKTLAAAHAEFATEWTAFVKEIEASKAFQWFLNDASKSLRWYKNILSDTEVETRAAMRATSEFAQSSAKEFDKLGLVARKAALADGFDQATSSIADFSARLEAASKAKLESDNASIRSNTLLRLSNKEQYDYAIKSLAAAKLGNEDNYKAQLLYIQNNDRITDGTKNVIVEMINQTEKAKELNNIIGEISKTIDELNQKQLLGSIIDTKGISIVRKEYEDFLKLSSDESKKYFEDNAKLYDKDIKTYKEYLQARLDSARADVINAQQIEDEAYKAYLKAKEKRGTEGSIIEQEAYLDSLDVTEAYHKSIQALEIAQWEERNKKGTGASKKDDSLAILKAQNKAELEAFKLLQQEKLLASRQYIKDNIKDIYKQEEALRALDEKNKQEALQKEIELQQKVVDITAKGSKEQFAEEAALSKLKTNLKTAETDEIINQQGRATKNYYDNLKIEKNAAISANYDALNDERLKAAENAAIAIQSVNNEVRSAKWKKTRIEAIEQDLVNTLLLIDLKYALERADIDNLTISEKQRIADEIAAIEEAQSKEHIDRIKKDAQTEAEILQRKKELSIQLINEAFNFTSALSNRALEMATRQRDREIDLAGDSLEKKMAAENKYEDEARKIKTRQAKADKAQSIFNIIVDTAAAIAKANPVVPLMILAGIVGAAQLATVVATPIPEFFEGVESKSTGGLSIVGEDKGSKKGGSELITLPSGNSFLSPDSATLMDLPAGTHIDSYSDTQKILANAAMNTAYERIDLSKSEKYLKSMAEKETIVVENGIKRVTRKGFQGEYSC